VAIVTVDALTTDLDLDVVDDAVTNERLPTTSNGVTRAVSNDKLGEVYLKVDTRDKITVAGNSADYALLEISGARECLLNGLHRKVCVTTVDSTEECNLRISSKENILRSIGN
jgi:hypothetical protein